MVLVLPKVPSFGEQFGQALGGGISQGMSQATQMAQALALEKQKMQQRQQLAESIYRQFGGEKFGQETDVADQLAGQQKPDSFALARALTAADLPELGKIETERAKAQEKERREIEVEERKIARGKGEKLLEKRDLSRDTLLQRQADFKIAKDAIERNPKDIASLKNFASDAFHLPQLRSAPAAAFASAMKDAFVNSIRSVPGARPNQWVEQQIQSAMARIGQSDEANLSALEIGQFKLDQEEMQNSIIDQIEDEALSKGQKITGESTREVYKRLKPYVEEKQFELGYKLKRLEEIEKGPEYMKKHILDSVPKGTPLTSETAQLLLEEAGGNEENAIKAAKKLGYEIPSNDLLKRLGYVFE